jgi:hypothetical protein
MRYWLATLVIVAVCTGCTSLSLERHTLNQIQSAADFRYEAALNCLAQVSANPAALPSYAILVDGTTRLQDMESVSATTMWIRALNGFSTQSLAPSLARQPQETWTCDPVADHTRLAAMGCACQYVLSNNGTTCSDCESILAEPYSYIEPHPEHADGAADKGCPPKPHYGVIKRLVSLPSGWLGCGCLKDVPARARYKAHCGDHWVWVTPEGLEGLAGFVLVLQDIATLDIDDGANNAPPLLVTLERRRPNWYFEFKDASLDPLKAGTNPRIREALLKQLKAQLSGRRFEGGQFLKEFPGIFNQALEAAKKEQGIADQIKNLNNADQFFRDFKKEILLALRAAGPYSKDDSFTEIRAIRPGKAQDIQDLIKKAIKEGKKVELTYAEWQEYTIPFRGARTGAKPDGGLGKPPATTVPARNIFQPLAPGSLVPAEIQYYEPELIP